MKLLEEIKHELIPTKEETKKVMDLVNDIIKKINKNLKHAKAILGGSGAKGTWLKDAHDADIFVLFDYKKYKSQSEKLSDILEKHLKRKFKVIRIHGSRDYFQVKIKNFTLEIIPILKISNAKQALNITDISPLHSAWVKKYKKVENEIRLTKKFCKAANVYGAESYINGFSGYVCEILTIYYGSFFKLAKAAARWTDKIIIDPSKHHKNVELEVNKSKLTSPLILIDPVQAGRNASAALSKEKFDLFREKCRQFLKKPSKEFFIEKKIDFKNLKNKYKNKIIVIEIQSLVGKRDIVGSKLLKAFEFLSTKLIDYGFTIKESNWEWDKEKKAIFYFISGTIDIKNTYERPGPPLKAKQHVKKFKALHKKTYVKNNKVYAIIERKITNPKEYIKFLLKDGYMLEKIKKVMKID